VLARGSLGKPIRAVGFGSDRTRTSHEKRLSPCPLPFLAPPLRWVAGRGAGSKGGAPSPAVKHYGVGSGYTSFRETFSTIDRKSLTGVT